MTKDNQGFQPICGPDVSFAPPMDLGESIVPPKQLDKGFMKQLIGFVACAQAGGKGMTCTQVDVLAHMIGLEKEEDFE